MRKGVWPSMFSYSTFLYQDVTVNKKAMNTIDILHFSVLLNVTVLCEVFFFIQMPYSFSFSSSNPLIKSYALKKASSSVTQSVLQNKFCLYIFISVDLHLANIFTFFYPQSSWFHIWHFKYIINRCITGQTEVESVSLRRPSR